MLWSKCRTETFFFVCSGSRLGLAKAVLFTSDSTPVEKKNVTAQAGLKLRMFVSITYDYLQEDSPNLCGKKIDGALRVHGNTEKRLIIRDTRCYSCRSTSQKQYIIFISSTTLYVPE